MTADVPRPNLRRIGENALTEVLGKALSLPVTLPNAPRPPRSSRPPDQISSTVLLAGQRLSGAVQLRLPVPFVIHTIRRLTGLEAVARDADAVLADAAGELANMVAGRVAVHLAACGYACTLDTPSLTRGTCLSGETDPGVEHGRVELCCAGHWLALELQCRYAGS